ncbi:hypothetical protein ACMGE9_11850 [Macrococcus sp. EM39E]|uniref:hypothetical protein n=1 Tax=Macrococcus animalis TaxID=3395467 RepID=UPI0039BE0A45
MKFLKNLAIPAVIGSSIVYLYQSKSKLQQVFESEKFKMEASNKETKLMDIKDYEHFPAVIVKNLKKSGFLNKPERHLYEMYFKKADFTMNNTQKMKLNYHVIYDVNQMHRMAFWRV